MGHALDLTLVFLFLKTGLLSLILLPSELFSPLSTKIFYLLLLVGVYSQGIVSFYFMSTYLHKSMLGSLECAEPSSADLYNPSPFHSIAIFI